MMDLDVFELIATGSSNGNGHSAPLDWQEKKREILSRLDVAAEYAALGVEFTRSTASDKGWRECRALGRQDDRPSAAVNLMTGVYKDSGGDGAVLGFFDFALRHGTFGRWHDCVKHYAEKAGVELGHLRSHSKHGGIQEAVYHYRNNDGSIRYAVFRYKLPNGKKHFSQRPPDGHGGWKTGSGCMDGVEPLPYRLPELLASDVDAPVWIVEGEKDCDRAAIEGLVTSTGHGGANNTDNVWPKISHYFKDRQCFIVPDNDPSGLHHARKIARYLHGIAKSVRLVELAGLPAKGDLSDWFDLGNGLEQLWTIAVQAEPWTPETDNSSPSSDATRDATVADLRHRLVTTGWLWPGWISSDALVLLAAEAGIGKTRFLADLCRRIYHGLVWPDQLPMTVPPGGRFLWICADGQFQEMCDLCRDFKIPDEAIVLNASADDPFGGTTLQEADDFASLEARIDRVQPRLVIIDTITNTGDFKSQDSSDAKRQYKPLQEIAVRCRVPIICVTHLNASGKVLGRRAVEKVRVVVQLDCPDPENQPTRRKLWVSKSKAMKPAALGVSMGSDGNAYDLDPPEAPDSTSSSGRLNGARTGPAADKTRECMAWLGEVLAFGQRKIVDLREEAEALGYSAKVLYRAKAQLGIIEFGEKPKQWKLCGEDTPF